MNLPKMKRCAMCGKRKRRDAFYLDRKRPGAFHTYCIPCCRLRAKDNYARSDKAKRSQKHREWVAQNREHIRAYKTAQAIGCTVEEVKELLARGCCQVCGATDRLRVDHCHRERRLRGLLCDNCNKALGFFADSTDRLAAAIVYLRR